MRISVALCTYNGASYLSEQLYSIAQQNRLPDELIICDDVSTDNTLHIVETFSKTASFTVRFYQNAHNLGSTKNFEQAIRFCEGDIIVLADQDDYWYSNKLKVIENIFTDHPDTGLVFSNADVVNAERQSLGYTLWESVRLSKQQKSIARGEEFSTLMKRPIVTGATMAFRETLRDMVLPISEEWIHDAWISLLISIVATIIPVEQPLMQYRRHANNQIGAESVNLLDRLQIALSTNPVIYKKRHKQFQALRAHVVQHLPENTSILNEITEKAMHSYVRGTMPDNRLKRIPAILKELRTGRYRQFSGSQLNAIRDFLLSHRN